MTIIDPDHGDFDDMPEPETQQDNGIKDLRRAAREGAAAKAEADALKRELAFLKAGVDTDSKAGQLLLKAYDGDLDPAKIAAEAQAIGALKAAAASTEPAQQGLSADEAQAHAARQSLTSGADAAGLPPEQNPYVAAARRHDDAYAKGMPRDEALGDAIRTIREAGAKGDTRVIVQGYQG